MKRILLCLFSTLIISNVQTQDIAPTPASQRIKALDTRNKLKDISLVSNIPFESIGPTVFSGRVSDIDVNPKDASNFYVAYASGGLWKTVNNGTSFEPIFDKEAVMTIGDIAVNWETNEIWVGTGEVNSSRSSYAGVGIYKSSDNGNSWKHMGLSESHHIARVIIHPGDPNTIWVAVLGHLYSSNKERGIYKTVDGGLSWKNVLYVNDLTGAVDLVIDPDNPDILYASTWQRIRKAWDFIESGKGSAIYKSIDGAESWEKITEGFPKGDGVGRIGLALSKIDGKTKLYAFLDNYFRRPEETRETTELVVDDFKKMSETQLLELKEEQLADFLDKNNFPEKYSAGKIRKLIKKGKIEVKAIAEYLEDANRLLFDTPVIGAELYVSDDEGGNWQKTHTGYLDGVNYSYGYYFGLIRVSPGDPNTIYLAGVPILKSQDGGESFVSINQENVHADHHALWINPDRKGHLINGNDGGINISYDDGEHWIKCNSPSVGQFYYINTDKASPYHVYGGTQDNGVWAGSHQYTKGVSWHNTGQYPYRKLLGADGMQVQIDSRDNETIYTGYQFGNYYRINKRTGKNQYITPRHELGERPYRWNWQAPIHLSIHNQDILYMGAHKVFRSMNQGEDFEAISGDLTLGGKKGDVPYGTLTTLHESSLKFGLIYTGSDDGLVFCTKDGGNNWHNISDNLPKNLWASRIQASSHKKSRVYLSLNGYRWDDFTSYAYVSENYGQTWNPIGLDLPAEPINAIKEDPTDPNIVYVATDHASYVSIDRGISFMRFDEGLPFAPVHDLVIQEEAGHLLLGTHGRSIYKADITPLQKINKIKNEEVYVYEISDIEYNAEYGKVQTIYSIPKTPEFKFPVYVKNSGEIEIAIESENGKFLKKYISSFDAGINYINYDLSIDSASKEEFQNYLLEKDKENMKLSEADNGILYLIPGEYKLVVRHGDNKHEQVFRIVEKN